MRRLRRAHQRNARQEAKRRIKFRQRAIAAGTAAAITLGAGVCLTKALAHTPDIHELPVSQDADADLLADAEEVTLGYCPFNPDQNRNEIPDGVDLAKYCAADINELPWQNEALPGETYKWWAPQFGLERCDICGAEIVMGSGGVVNPRLGLDVRFPFLMTLHYMEHGSFSYEAHYGDEPVEGRIDVPALVQALELTLPFDPNAHQIPVAEDTDGDLLADNEEKALAYLPFNPDQNRNDTLDGVELARLCTADINDLPTWDPQSGVPEPNETYKWYILTFGLETCDICGQQFNMGGVVVVNPNRSLTVNCPFISLHYMEHGSYSYAGSTNKGRLDVPTLLQALELRLPCEPDDHQLPVPEDADADMLSNREEFAIGYRPFRPDQNRNEIPDGVELAKRCTEVIDQLPQIAPEDPPPNETYKVEHLARGNENCCICGVPINMGTLEIVNPPLGLRVEFPILSLHYMGHGSFSYDGTTNTGRTNVPLLLRTIELRFPYDPNAHQLPVDGNDLDEDFLADSEELKAGYNLHDPDQDNTLVPDGIELARQCAAVVSQLPEYYLGGGEPPNQTYKMEHALDGLEQCDICGQWIHMGGWEIINPKLGLHYPDSNDPLNGTFLPDLALHYMGHGSFNCFGDEHTGRVDIALLAKVLEMPRRCGDLGTLYLPADLNEDCRVNFTDFIELADKWLESTDPNQDGDTER
jgi:hypothetical protein